MAACQPLNFEGTVIFPSQPSSSYHYRLTCVDDQLNVWLEDRSTKKQWESGKQNKSDFVQKDGDIPQTSTADYALCFQECMATGKSHDDPGGGPLCDIYPLKGDKWTVEFTLKLEVFQSAWKPKYRLVLNSVPLEKVDIVVSTLRDIQEAIDAIRNDVCQLKADIVNTQERIDSVSDDIDARVSIVENRRCNY